MNSQFLVQPNELLLSLTKEESPIIIPYTRTFTWLVFCALAGYVITRLPEKVVRFFQKPIGMYIIVFGVIHSSVDFNTSPAVLLKLIISSLVYTILIQVIIHILVILFGESEEIIIEREACNLSTSSESTDMTDAAF
jgi:hypothetical protein